MKRVLLVLVALTLLTGCDVAWRYPAEDLKVNWITGKECRFNVYKEDGETKIGWFVMHPKYGVDDVEAKSCD